MDLSQVGQGFVAAGIPQRLVDELLAAYVEAKRRYYLGDHRPQEVEGGRFSEAVFRILQHLCGHTVTPLSTQLPSVDKLLLQYENATAQPDSIRMHIPRTLRVIYDIRNKRDAAHITDGIDPNLQDATLVIDNMDWVMAELVRLHHGVSANEAQAIIEDLVTKEVPAVQEIHGQPVILKDLQARDQAMLMLYRAGAVGGSLDEVAGWLREKRKDNLSVRLEKLDDAKLVLHHPKDDRYYITDRGIKYVEKKKLARPV
jgi:hypothetical protein